MENNLFIFPIYSKPAMRTECEKSDWNDIRSAGIRSNSPAPLGQISVGMINTKFLKIAIRTAGFAATWFDVMVKKY